MDNKINDYRPIECGLHSEYELAIMHGRLLNLCWQDEKNTTFHKTVKPIDIFTRNRQEFLLARDGEGQQHEIRLDRITRSDINRKADA